MPRHWQQGLQGGFCEKRPGLSRAGHSQFQTAPVDPLQDTAEPSSQDGHASGKTHLRRERKHHQRSREGGPLVLRRLWLIYPTTVIPFPKGNTGSRSQQVLVSNKLSGKGGSRWGHSWLWHLSSQATVMCAEVWLPRTPAC